MGKLNIKNPKSGMSHLSFAPMSLCSLDFGRPQPFMMIDTVPSDEFNATGSALCRVTPQVFPPFGRLSLKHATFFVPENILSQTSTAFHNDQKTFQGKPVVHPFFYAYQINQIFAEGSLLSEEVTGSSIPSLDSFDFVSLKDSSTWSLSSPIRYWRLTTRGRKAFSILKALGYDFVTMTRLSSSSDTRSSQLANYSIKCNAYPLIAYMKIIADKFMNGQYYEQSPIVSFLNHVYNSESGDINYNASTGQLLSSSSDEIQGWIDKFSNFGVMYESNMYNTAWNTVNSPIGSSPDNSLLSSFGPNYSPSDISPVKSGEYKYGEFGSLEVGPDYTVHSDTATDNYATFSAYGHKMLMAVDKFIRRKGLVGTRAAQQFYAMFGIKGSDYTRNMVTLVNTGSQRLTFNAITSTADTQTSSGGSPLGQYAGQGIGGLEVSFNYKADTFGYLISVCWLNIDAIIQRGINPACLRNNYLDYFRPQFEGQYNRPIPLAEITGGHRSSSINNKPKNTFGFVPIFEEYKYMRDNVSGAFIDNTTEKYAFMRDYTKEVANDGQNSQLLAQSNVVTTYFATRGNPSITNPFLYDSSVGDRFWFCVDWKIDANRPMMQKEDTLGIEGAGDLEIEEVNGALK